MIERNIDKGVDLSPKRVYWCVRIIIRRVFIWTDELWDKVYMAYFMISQQGISIYPMQNTTYFLQIAFSINGKQCQGDVTHR